MKGRRPKTEEELKARGTFKRTKHADRVHIEGLEELPPPPEGFDAEATAWWYHFCADIQKSAVLAEQHLNAVRLMSTLMCDRRRLTEDIEENGYTYKSYVTLRDGSVVPGQIRQNPAFSLRKQIDDQLIRLYEQSGFTLRSGMTIKAPEKKPTASILELMKPTKAKAG